MIDYEFYIITIIRPTLQVNRIFEKESKKKIE